MKKEISIEQAKETLKNAGYFVDNLWHIDDVKVEFECIDEEAQDVLYHALTTPSTMEHINEAIKIIAEVKQLTEKK